MYRQDGGDSLHMSRDIKCRDVDPDLQIVEEVQSSTTKDLSSTLVLTCASWALECMVLSPDA